MSREEGQQLARFEREIETLKQVNANLYEANAAVAAERDELRAQRRNLIVNVHRTGLRVADALQKLADEIREDVEVDRAALKKLEEA